MALSVLAAALKAQYKGDLAACIEALFPEASKTERQELMRNLNYDEVTSRNRRLLARDQEVGEPRDPDIPPLSFGVPGGFGPNTSTHPGLEQDEDPEMEEKINMICEALGVDPERDKEVYDGIVRRVRSRARDQGPSPDPLRKVPPVADPYAKDTALQRTRARLYREADQAVAAAYPTRGRVGMDAAPRRGHTFEDRFADLVLPGIQG